MTGTPPPPSPEGRPASSTDRRDELARLVAEVSEQQYTLQLRHFDHDDAWRLGHHLVELARARGLPVVVDVRRPGHVLFHVSLPGTTPDNDTWVTRKSRVVERFGEPSFLVGLRSRVRGSTFAADSGLPEQEYAAHGGAFPVTVRGTGIVATVTVSGLPQAEDHALVVEGLTEMMAAQEREA